MNTKQTNYLLIATGIFVVFCAIYSANVRPAIPEETKELLKRVQLTENDYQFASCYLYYESQLRLSKYSEVHKEIADYCRKIVRG